MNSIERYGLVAAGGALGCMLRYWAAVHFGARPSTTFMVNVCGSFLIGVLLASPVDLRFRLLLGSGFLGGLTTFSTWQIEAVLSARDSDWRGAAVNLFGSLVAGFLAAGLGYVSTLRLRT